MSNQVIVWSMLILPWLTLFFMPREDIKRWMPAALFVMVTNTIIVDVGVTWKIWETRENIYPLNEMISFVYGALPIGAMWILKYTYGRFWLYAVVQLTGSLVFILFVQSWLHRRGILVWIDENAFAGIGAFATTLTQLILVYIYQMWQESVFVHFKRINLSPNVQPAAAKPLDPNEPDNDP